MSGRRFFEEIIRENIDLGRPEQVQLIFSRKLRKSTVADGRCRTRIINEGVIPSRNSGRTTDDLFRGRLRSPRNLGKYENAPENYCYTKVVLNDNIPVDDSGREAWYWLIMA